MRYFARASLVAAAMLLLAAVPAAAVDVPYLTGRVVDNAEILKPATRERVVALAKVHEDKTTDQIAVLTIPTLGGESVEEFATRVFEAWKLGQRSKDNGVLVVVAPQDRKMRIEVGYGLEGTLTDVAASRIIRDVMTPAFKSGDFDRGIEDGVKARSSRSSRDRLQRRGPPRHLRTHRRPEASANPRSSSRDRTCRGTCGSCSDPSSSASSASSPSSA
jgi:uncharacterized membrane protein YgcG